jgi:hypothetical protein
VIVNGPARSACGGVAAGFGALGAGHRANASIGRALRLCLINIGGGRPGLSDMALHGHPGKFAYVLAEAEEESPFPPLHTSFGFAPDESTVTVVGTEAPHSVVSTPGADPARSAERLLTSLALVAGSMAGNNANLLNGTIVVVLNPEHAATLAAAGFDRAGIQDSLVARAVNRRSDLRRLNPGFLPDGPGDEMLPALHSRDAVVVIVAGGGGIYSMVMPSWGAGPHGNPAVVARIDLFPACEIPLRRPPGS